MQNITKYLVGFMLAFIVQFNYAQDVNNSEQISDLQERKIDVQTEEKSELKKGVEAINVRLDNKEVTQKEASELKTIVAKKHALNIENRLAIIDNKIALLERNETLNKDLQTSGNKIFISIGKGKDSDKYDSGSIYIGPEDRKKPVIYDRRTSSDFVFAIGFNNAITQGESLNDSPYKLGGSGFVELGWAWKTRVFENTNAVRFKYGVSLQWNKLNIKDNLYFAEENDVVSLEAYPLNLKKSKFRTTNLVIPIHFEFGPSKKIEGDNYFRYSTYRKFKIGVGGYGGVVLQSLQKLKYTENGNSQKDKFKDYNTNNFVYGLSSYISWGNVGVYAKYDLSTMFKNQAIDRNNISLGLRFDMD
ncbi:hypothetical protein BZARG_1339 [Bizionia argentinensis JUB59]|uniref:PorT family protein n=1 Tax=Bizionia argentinensis JUB59 TaxID=1046627 RepID=G2EDI9_9FLAO|nr:hypothetical protein [Bizionia argentinensis]EGV43459.1 hypothetical protein BZARG_1339 [Bizionia argentinensis JUB59]